RPSASKVRLPLDTPYAVRPTYRSARPRSPDRGFRITRASSPRSRRPRGPTAPASREPAWAHACCSNGSAPPTHQDQSSGPVPPFRWETADFAAPRRPRLSWTPIGDPRDAWALGFEVAALYPERHGFRFPSTLRLTGAGVAPGATPSSCRCPVYDPQALLKSLSWQSP